MKTNLFEKKSFTKKLILVTIMLLITTSFATARIDLTGQTENIFDQDLNSWSNVTFNKMYVTFVNATHVNITFLNATDAFSLYNINAANLTGILELNPFNQDLNNTDSPTFEDLTVNDDIYLQDYIYHLGDLDTYLNFNTNQFDFYAGGVNTLDMDATDAIFNTGGIDYNFRVESENDAYMFFVDGGLDRIGIRDDTPSYTLDVNGDFRTTGDAFFNDDIVVTNRVTAAAIVGDGGNITNLTGVAGAKGHPHDQDLNTSSTGVIFNDLDVSTMEATLYRGQNDQLKFGDATTVSDGTRTIAIGVGADSGGVDAIAIGVGAEASGFLYPIAIGFNAIADGVLWATAIGVEAHAYGAPSFALGYQSSAGGDATALGYKAKADAVASMALGRDANASGPGAMACGAIAKASAIWSTALGYNAESHQLYSMAIGQNAITWGNGKFATALGSYTNASAWNSVAIGRYTNATEGNTTQFGWSGIPMDVNVTGTLNMTGLVFPTAPPTTPYNGSVWFNGTTGKLGIYSTTLNGWYWK